MRTYSLHYPSGEPSGFEVPNTWLQPRAAGRLLTANGATVTFRRGLLLPGNVHLRFTFAGHEFELVEPYGDSSRYVIIPAEGSQAPTKSVEELMRIFSQYRPGVFGMLRSVLGG